MSDNIKTQNFIKKAQIIHGDKYDYSLSDYKNCDIHVIIICRIHGQFLKTPYSHLRRSLGCNLCNKKITDKNLLANNFFEKAKKIHGDKYDYSLVDYINNETNIIIICSIHGQFKQKPIVHLNSYGCKICSNENMSKKFTLTNEYFIKKAKETHGDKYDYSIVKYISACDPVKIICSEHGIFEQSPDVHYRAGCPTCGLITSGLNRRKTNEQFIKDAKELHGDKYDYSLVKYQCDTTKIEIICQTHGVFKQTAGGHLQGHGCIRCGRGNVSKKQLEWLNYIAKKEKIYIQHVMNDGEFKVGKYKIDGYCKETNTCYEFLGDLWHGNPSLYKHFDINPVNKRYYGDLYISTLEKQVYIMNQGYIYISIWEDEWDAIVKNNKQIQ